MTPHFVRRAFGRIALVLLAALAFVPRAHAEDYVLGAEDVVSVSVWLHPELERVLTINSDGNVTLAPIGELKAAGMTTKQLGEKISDRLSSYLRQTTTVTVTVSQFMSHSVFVTGAVAKPGRYGFERIPSLVEVLGTAGGAQPLADLSAVQILRKEGDTRRTLTADLSAALRTGDTSGLPELKPGDSVVIPGGIQGSAGGGASDGVGVLGEVAKPGIYPVGSGADVWSVLATAGGLSARGNLSDVRLLTRADAGQNVVRVDLRKVLDHGSRAPVVIHPGDVLVVMPRGPNAWTGLTSLLALSRDALNVVVLVDYFNNRTTTK